MEEGDNKTIIKKPWVAGFLSVLLPGLGHFYSGQIKKSIGFHLGIWVYLVLVWILSLGQTFAGLVTVISLGLIYDLIISLDATITTKKQKTIEQRAYDKWYIYLFLIFLIGIVFEFAYQPAYEKYAKVQFAKSTSPAMAPALTTGDKFAWQKTQIIQKDDIAVFEFTNEPNSLYVYRCVASPGDKFEIKQGQVFINDIPTENRERLMFQYQVDINGSLNQLKLHELGINAVSKLNEQTYVCYLTVSQVEELKKNESVIDVSPLHIAEGKSMENLFPINPFQNWNIDYYGPLVLPKKGGVIEIDKENSMFFGTVISMSEDEAQVELNEQGLLVVNGQIVNSYTFKHDYYFMMGDNRHNSADSRYRGLVPDNLIKGKALYVWWSDVKEKIGMKI